MLHFFTKPSTYILSAVFVFGGLFAFGLGRGPTASPPTFHFPGLSCAVPIYVTEKAAGGAFYHPNPPSISIPPLMLQPGWRAFLPFMLEHECGHHLAPGGYTSLDENRRLFGTTFIPVPLTHFDKLAIISANEQAANCYAAKLLKHNALALHLTLNSLKFTKMNPSKNPHPAQIGRPTPQQDMETIITCANMQMNPVTGQFVPENTIIPPHETKP